jgi:hypothetical protein
VRSSTTPFPPAKPPNDRWGDPVTPSPGVVSPDQVIADVLDSLRQSRVLLLDPCPRNIDRCRLAITQSVHKVGKLIEGDRSAWKSPGLKASLLLVRGELSAIAKLLDSAAVFRRDMLRVISGATRPHVVELDAAALDRHDQKARRVHVLG